MTWVYWCAVITLLLSLSTGMWRIIRGPSIADSMLAMQMFGTTTVAILLLIAQAIDDASLRDVSLVFALLSAVTIIAFVRREWAAPEFDDDPD